MCKHRDEELEENNYVGELLRADDMIKDFLIMRQQSRRKKRMLT